MIAIVTTAALCIAGGLNPAPKYKLERAIGPNGRHHIFIVPVDAHGETPRAVRIPPLPQWWPSWAPVPATPIG